MERVERVVPPVPMPTFKLAVTRAEVDEGSKLFANFCVRCHGGDVVSGGLTPDLRYAKDSTHQMFQDIVLGGAYREFGMPSFAGDLTAPQVRSIEGYILSRARESAAAEGAGKH